MSTQIEDIKARLDIAEVVRGYIKVEKAGVNFKALCPFHNEKTPSFFISPSRQTWHCFGCGEGGDIFTFIQKIEGIEFVDALKLLADKAGVVLERINREQSTQRSILLEMHERAAAFFQEQLARSERGRKAYAYLHERGLTTQTIDEFRLGYAPYSSSGLLQYLLRFYKLPLIERAGLVARGRGGFADRFRGRIIFPIADVQGRIVGFSGRLFESESSDPPQAKYLNSPQTPLFDKGKLLYGLDRAKLDIRKANACVLVEGQMDLLMAHQAGTIHTVATSGTALTSDHLRILKRYTPRMVIAFDMDTAGDTATQRGIILAVQEGFTVNVVQLPEGKDPADLIKKDASQWNAAVGAAKSIIDFHIDAAFGVHSAQSAEGKKLILKRVLPALKAIPNAVEQSHYVQLLSRRLGAREDDVRREMTKETAAYTHTSGVAASPPPVKTRRDMLAERLIMLLAVFPDARGDMAVEPRICGNEAYEEVVRYLISPEKEAAALADAGAMLLSRLTTQFEGEIEMMGNTYTLADAQHEVGFVVRELRRIQLQDELQEVAKAIKDAEYQNDTPQLSRLTERFRELTRELAQAVM